MIVKPANGTQAITMNVLSREIPLLNVIPCIVLFGKYCLQIFGSFTYLHISGWHVHTQLNAFRLNWCISN